MYHFLDKANMASTKYQQAEVKDRVAIAAIITTPDSSWANRKKQYKYNIPRNYFGQYA